LEHRNAWRSRNRNAHSYTTGTVRMGCLPVPMRFLSITACNHKSSSDDSKRFLSNSMHAEGSRTQRFGLPISRPPTIDEQRLAQSSKQRIAETFHVTRWAPDVHLRLITTLRRRPFSQSSDQVQRTVSARSYWVAGVRQAGYSDMWIVRSVPVRNICYSTWNAWLCRKTAQESGVNKSGAQSPNWSVREIVLRSRITTGD